MTTTPRSMASMFTGVTMLGDEEQRSKEQIDEEREKEQREEQMAEEQSTEEMSSEEQSNEEPRDLEKADGVRHVIDDDIPKRQGERCSLRERIRHFTWAWFTLTMSTGGIAILLARTPHRFHGLETIGKVFFILDLVLFVCLCLAISTRFVLFPQAMAHSFRNTKEGLFFATFWLSVADIIICTQLYGYGNAGPWLSRAVRVLFWMYSAFSFLTAVFQYHFLFTGKPLTMQSMTPAWLLPIFPIMLAGTIASVIAGTQPEEHAIPVIIGGITFQGLGMMVAIFVYANYIRRLLSLGLPSPNFRPGMFIAVGPPSFTALALIAMSDAALTSFPKYYIEGTSMVPTAEVLKIVSVFFGIFLWTLAFWFFCLSVIAVVSGFNEMTFHLSWWSFVFPNTGFTIATIQIGHALHSNAILWVSSAMTIVMVTLWFLVVISHAWAVFAGQILWPGRDEDHVD
ncbi:MAG: hypothetical protein M1819_006036 [Sarea resinae]|nr:MAG: hypothetical protein M1819_006036 [Sarea resinae]